MFVFDIVAVAFGIALVLYEYYQYLAAHHQVLTTSSKVVWNPTVKRVQVMASNGPRSAVDTATMIWARYSRRSLVFHQLNARQFGDVQAEFKSWPFFLVGLMGAALFTAVGLPALTALGMGVVGGVVAFVSKQGRDLAGFSNEMAQFDADVKNAHAYARRLTGAAKRSTKT